MVNRLRAPGGTGKQVDSTTLQLLLDKGADVNVKGADGFTVLNYAKGTGNQKLIQMLNKAGARQLIRFQISISTMRGEKP